MAFYIPTVIAGTEVLKYVGMAKDQNKFFYIMCGTLIKMLNLWTNFQRKSQAIVITVALLS
jgi:hypothetical protein